MADAYKIMLVEDDGVIAERIVSELKKWGYEAFSAEDLSDVSGCFEKSSPHLIVMDISLPFFNGFYWCERIRRFSAVPIIFLSSRTEDMDVVMGMSMGGDDYITKPVSMDVLVAKVTAMLRRCYDIKTERAALPVLTGSFDPARCEVTRGGMSASLTKNESRILLALCEGKGKVISRETLMLRLWDSDQFIDDNTLTVNINRLRRKLSSIGLEDAVCTHKGSGYSLMHGD